MKIKHILLLGIVGILGLGFSNASQGDYIHEDIQGTNYTLLSSNSDTSIISLGDDCVYIAYAGIRPDYASYFGLSSNSLDYYFSSYPSNWFPSKTDIGGGIICGNGIYYQSEELYFFLLSGLNKDFNGEPSIKIGFYDYNVNIEPGFNNLNSLLGVGDESLCYVGQGGNGATYGMSFYSHNELEPIFHIGDLSLYDNSHVQVFCSRTLWLYSYAESTMSLSDIIYSYGYYQHSFYTGLVLNSDGGTDNQVGYVVPDGSIFDYNTYLIEQAVKCYMSSGEIGICDGINYTGYIEQFNPYYRLRKSDEQKGYLEFANAQPILTDYCLNGESINYAFCSQLDIYSGVDLLYYYENGELGFVMLGSGFGISVENLGSGQIGSVSCQGAWCNGNVSTGLTEYIIPVGSSGFDYTGNINYYDGVFSGNLLSGEYFKDLFINHLFFDCPYQYKDNAFVIGGKLINLLGGRDIIYPVNCIIAGYQEGYKSSLFGSFDNILPWDGPLLNSDSDGFKKLYLLFDIILSFGIALLFIKFFSSHSH